MTDHYYVSAQDAGRTIPVLGPFTSELSSGSGNKTAAATANSRSG